jgi:hypothetical protein
MTIAKSTKNIRFAKVSVGDLKILIINYDKGMTMI